MIENTGARKGRVTLRPIRLSPIRLSRDQVWPAIIIIGLTIMVLVNAAFIWIAVSGADEVVPSYNAGQR